MWASINVYTNTHQEPWQKFENIQHWHSQFQANLSFCWIHFWSSQSWQHFPRQTNSAAETERSHWLWGWYLTLGARRAPSSLIIFQLTRVTAGRRGSIEAMEKEGEKRQHNSPLFLPGISPSHSLGKFVGIHMASWWKVIKQKSYGIILKKKDLFCLFQ